MIGRLYCVMRFSYCVFSPRALLLLTRHIAREKGILHNVPERSNIIMIMRRRYYFFGALWLVLVAAAFFALPVAARAAGSASLYVGPSSGTFTVGSTFTVSIYVNTGGQFVNAVEANLSFPPNMLQVVSPTAGKYPRPAAASRSGRAMAASCSIAATTR